MIKHVQKTVKQQKLTENLCLIRVSHTTAAVISHENKDFNTCKGLLASLSNLVPKQAKCGYACLTCNAVNPHQIMVKSPETLTFMDSKLIPENWPKAKAWEFDRSLSKHLMVSLTGK